MESVSLLMWPSRWLPAVFVALLAVAVLPVHGRGQQAPIFRGGVQTVALYATVTDSSGRLVPDLQQKDFDIYDNGKLQTITVFKSDVQPVTVLLTLDTSGSQNLNLDLVVEAAEAFVLRLLPLDKSRITNFDDKIITSPAFTADRDELVRYIRNGLQFGNGTRLWDAVDDSMSKLAAVDGRRVVLLLTDGYDEVSLKSTLDSVIRRAQSEDFMVYSVGLQVHLFGQTRKPDSGIRRLAETTGGGYFELTRADDLNSTFTRVADELHRQYVLGFAAAVLDNKLHQVEVRVRQPGMTARARKSYLASKSTQ
jgi:Ca-activated chloride channel family protein